MSWAKSLKVAAVALANKTAGAQPFAVVATASSGLPVSLASSTPAVCTLQGKMVTVVGIGQCTIVATQPGDTSFNPAAEVGQSFQVNSAGQMFTAFLPLVERE